MYCRRLFIGVLEELYVVYYNVYYYCGVFSDCYLNWLLCL